MSGEAGTYQIALLPPGRYRVRAELQGFRTEERDLTLVVSQNARFDVTMGVGTIEEAITVQAAAPLVDTRDADQLPRLEEVGIRARSVPLMMTGLDATAAMAAAAVGLVA